MRNTLRTLLLLFLFFVRVDATLVGEWRMDGCVWDGSAGEVHDSSGNGYDGTAKNDAVTLGDAPFILCRHADLRGKYIALEKAPSLGDTWSLSLWVRFPLTPTSGQISINDYYYFILATVEGTGDLGYFAQTTDDENVYKWGVYDNDGHLREIDDMTIAPGWHHVVQVAGDGKTKLYIDGEYIGKVTTLTQGDLVEIGTSTDGEDNQTIGAYVDEVKIFDEALEEESVQGIYNNEKAGLSYDGTARTCMFCPYELAGAYRMDECRWTGSDGEVKDSSGNSFDLTGLNGADTTEGMLCRSGIFDGDDDKVGGDWAYTFRNAVTLTAWIRTEGGHASYARVVEFSSHGGDYRYGTALAYDANGKVLRGWTANSDGDRSEEVSYDLSANGYHDGAWHFVAYVYTGSEARLYLDNVLVDRKTTDISDIEDPDILVIGGYYPNDDHGFHGEIDEVKIFATALDDLQLTLLYDNEKSGRNFEGSPRVCKCLVPLGEYRMDECTWTGNEGEVRDSSGNGYDATAENGPVTLARRDAGGGLCRVGLFDGEDDYLALDTFPHLDGSRSVTAWFRTEDASRRGQRIFADDEVNDAGNYALSLGDPGEGKVRFYIRGLDPVSLDSGAVVEAGKWYFVAAVFDAESMTKRLYIYDASGAKIDEVSQSVSGTVATPSGSVSIGGETSASSESDRKFAGMLDEVKIFDAAMEAEQIAMIAENEAAMIGYDGIRHVCPCCIARMYTGEVVPLQFEGGQVTLQDTEDNPGWTHVAFSAPFDVTPVVFIVPESYGDNPASTRIKNVTTEGFDAIMAEPQGEDGPHYSQHVSYFAINPGLHRIGEKLLEVGTLRTDKTLRASRGETVTEEWEEVETLFADCTPAVVAQIQSLVNETGLDIPDPDKVTRSTPWLTAAVDSNGNGLFIALERSETDEGSVDASETVAYMAAEPGVADSFVDDEGREILFETIRMTSFFRGWDDGCKTVPYTNTYSQTPLIAASKNSRFEGDGGWFRRCALDETEVGFLIDEDGSIYSRDEHGYVEPPQDRERHHRGEDGSIFVFSESFHVRESIVPNGTFDAWDIFREIDDRNISTKVVGAPFSLTVASLTETGETYSEFNGTVCIRVVGRDSNRSLSVWTKLLFEEQNITTALLTGFSAAKEAAVDLVWKRDTDAACPPEDADGEILSTDSFALRPDRFLFAAPPPDANLTAQHAYVYPKGVKAVASDGATAVADYNTTVAMGTVKRMRNGEVNASLAGTLHSALTPFADGMADLNLSFDDVAIVTLELNDTLWCAVDADDTPEANRTIYGERNVTFVPHRFELLFATPPTLEDNDTAHGFTYLSNDLAMSAWARGLTLDVRALGEAGGVLQNFSGPVTGPLFADPVDISPLLTLPAKHSEAVVLGAPQPQTGVDLGFEAGEAVLAYSDTAFNYLRTYDAPVDPFHVAGGDANVTVALSDSRYPAVAGSVFSTFGGGATFYFGRLRAEEIKTTEKHAVAVAELEVFDENAPTFVTGFRQNSLRWYRNAWHDTAMNGRIREANATAGVALEGTTDATLHLAYDTFGEGTVNVEVNATASVAVTRTIHLDVDPWLWHVPRGFGGSYDYGAGSDCSRHPCFTYTLEIPGGGRGVATGDFNGSDFDAESLDANVTYQRRRGVKLFR